jgi:hypothetical protein
MAHSDKGTIWLIVDRLDHKKKLRIFDIFDEHAEEDAEQVTALMLDYKDKYKKAVVRTLNFPFLLFLYCVSFQMANARKLIVTQRERWKFLFVSKKRYTRRFYDAFLHVRR